LVPGGGELVPASIATIQLAQELLQWAAAVLVPAVVVPAATVVIIVVSVAVVVPATTVVVIVVVSVAIVVPAAAVVVATAVVAIAVVVPAATVVVATTIVAIAVVVPAATVVVSTSTSIQQSLTLVAVELRSAACVVTVDFSLELLGRPSVPACRADWRGGLNSCPAVPAAVAAAVGANQILDILQVAPPLA